MRVEVIVPHGKLFDVEKFVYLRKTSYMTVAKKAKSDFERTTRTWERRPTFYIKDEQNGLIVGTDDQGYAFVNDGTDAHIILPRGKYPLVFQKGYKSKTLPNTIQSFRGGKFGEIIRSRFVRHPGIEPRRFDLIILKNTEKMIQTRMIDVVKICNK